MSAAELFHTSEDLESYLASLVPNRCRRGEELCPRLAGLITIYCVGFGNLPPDVQKEEAQKAIDVISSAEDTCPLEVGTVSTWGGEQINCRNGELCGGMGGMQAGLFDPDLLQDRFDVDE